MNIITKNFFTIKRIHSILLNEKETADGKEIVKYPVMKNYCIRRMKIGEEETVASIIAQCFKDDIEYFKSPTILNQFTNFLGKMLKNDEIFLDDMIVAVGEKNTNIIGVCRLRNSERY